MIEETIITVDLSDHATLMECYVGLNKSFRKQKERIAELEAALLPFAAIADESTANLADNYMYPDCFPMSAFRAARAALEKAPEDWSHKNDGWR